MVALFFTVPLYDNLRLYLTKSSYVPDVMTIQSAHYVEGHRTGPKYWYLSGVLDSGPEEDLTGYEINPEPSDQSSLQNVAPIGDRIPVYYNANEPDLFLNGHKSRVLTEGQYDSVAFKDVVLCGSLVAVFGALFIYFVTIGAKRS